MIVIYTDRDLAANCEALPLGIVRQGHMEIDLIPPSSWADDVYFWRDGEAKALKRRNHPLTVPDWLKDLEGVDR